MSHTNKSLLADLNQIVLEGWKNVTNKTVLFPRLQKQGIQVLHAGTRNSVIRPSDEFFIVFPLPIFQYLADEVNRRAQHASPHGKQITAGDLTRMAGMILHQCTHSGGTLTDYLKAQREGGLTKYTWEKIVGHFGFNEKVFFAKVNAAFQSNLVLRGVGTLDETMYDWCGSHFAVTYMERKPDPWGLKCISLAFPLGQSDRAYCVLLLPDIGVDPVTSTQALEVAKALLVKHPNTALCGDRWFGSIHWLAANPSTPSVLAISSIHHSHLWGVFGHKLAVGDYRVFSNGRILVTVFQDVDFVKTAANTFTITDEQVDASSPLQSLVETTPRFSPDAVQVLAQLSASDLKVVANAFGVAPGE